jgi:hypothetical protein
MDTEFCWVEFLESRLSEDRRRKSDVKYDKVVRIVGGLNWLNMAPQADFGFKINFLFFYDLLYAQQTHK